MTQQKILNRMRPLKETIFLLQNDIKNKIDGFDNYLPVVKENHEKELKNLENEITKINSLETKITTIAVDTTKIQEW